MKITRHKNGNYDIRMMGPEFEGLKLLVGLGKTVFPGTSLDGKDVNAGLSLVHGVANVIDALEGVIYRG
jgi:hypothetical protein